MPFFRGFCGYSAACELLEQTPDAVASFPAGRVDEGPVMENAMLDPQGRAEESLSRLELWLGVIATYLILIAFLFGYVANHVNSAEDHVAPSNKYA